MPGRGFILFRNFLLFFSKFSCPFRVWTELGTKIWFFSFSAYLIPVLAKVNVGKRFLNFFTIFLGIFLPWPSLNGITGKNFFFFSFSAYLNPFWLTIMPGRGFLIFWIFLLFLSEFYCPGRVWTEFGAKILFSLFRHISSHFG